MSMLHERSPAIVSPTDPSAPGMRFDVETLAATELASLSHWVAWAYEPRPGDPKPTKVPRQPRSGWNASTTTPSHWAPFEVAVARAHQEGWGVGFVFHATLNPFAGVDLDACRDPQTGLLVPWAQSIVAAFDSYTEVSPSGCGVKIIVRGKPRHHGKKLGAGGTAVEVYGQERYFTLTGWAV
ncbi:MAG: hypothetical protein ACRERC_15220 [Candidatus Binatia bacterium]